MSWRNSPLFERQFEAITALGGVSVEDIGYILNESDDEPLLILAKGLEKRGDSRVQYIRDMCRLTLGEERPIAPLYDRVIAFERSLDSDANCFYHSIGEYTLVTLNVADMNADECMGIVRPELLEFTGRSTAHLKLIVDLAVSYMMPDPDVGTTLISVLLEMREAIRRSGGQFEVLIGTTNAKNVFMFCGVTPKPFLLASDVDEALELAEGD